MILFRQTMFATALAFAACCVPGAQAHEIKFGNLVIHHPWSRASTAEAHAASGYMTITNKGKVEDRLLAATAEISSKAVLHDASGKRDLAGGLVIPPGAVVKLTPKSLQILFPAVEQALEPGEIFGGTLQFEKAGTVSIDYEVAAPEPGGD